MKLRDTIQFFTDLPDGAVENERGTEFLVWPGRPAAEAICEVLRSLDCDVGPIVSADFKGWEFDFSYRRRRFWTRVSVIERHIACFVDRGLWPRLIGRSGQLHVELLVRLNAALARDGRFRDVRWYASDEVETDFEGARQPVA